MATFIATSDRGSSLFFTEHHTKNRESVGDERKTDDPALPVSDAWEILPFASRRKKGGDAKGLMKNSVCAQSCSTADANSTISTPGS